MKIMSTITLGAALALGSAAHAQEGAAGADASSTTTSGTASESTATAASAAFRNDEVQQFASAAMEVQKIQKDSSVTPADQQAKMAAVVQQSGLSPERFNEIALASRSDPALMQRIQAAAMASPSAQTPTAPSASGTEPTPAAPGAQTPSATR